MELTRGEYDKVEKLKRRVDRIQSEKSADDEEQKRRTARQRLIDGEPEIQKEMHFYCPRHGDFISNGRKVIETDWTNPEQKIAYYRAYGYASFIDINGRATPGRACARMIRRITDKFGDPFFRQSKVLQKMRIDMADDLLQPGDPRFNAKYGDPYKEYNARLEAEEEANYYNNKRNGY
jgi:hypothetical protein